MARKRELHFMTKVINGIRFTSHKYEKGKYLITAKGYKGERWVCYNTWEKRNDGDITDGRSSFSPKNKRYFKASFKMIEEIKETTNIPKLTDLYPMPLLLVAPKSDLESIREYVLNVISNNDEVKYKLEKELVDEFIINENSVFSLFFTLFTTVKDHKKHYRKLAKIYHPDMGGNEEIFKDMQCAYEDLL